MKNLSLKSDLHLLVPTPSASSSNPPSSFKLVVTSCAKNLKHRPPNFALTLRQQSPTPPITLRHTTRVEPSMKGENWHSRIVIMGAVSVGILAVLLSEEKAWALGPEGPLVEEFWDNVRRYGLYALTVSTGALYTILRPILELLKNPISAIFILAIFGGSIYILSQVLSAMFGISEFNYDYGY